MFLREKFHLSLQERGGIIALHSRGFSKHEIAETFNCHPNTVKRWIRRYDETIDVLRKPGSGRPRKTTPEEDNMLLDAVRAKPITTAEEILSKIVLNYFNNKQKWIYFR